MSNNIQPLSKRSRRLLVEASRHITYAHKSIDRLSLKEYQLLKETSSKEDPRAGLLVHTASLSWLVRVIGKHLAERS